MKWHDSNSSSSGPRRWWQPSERKRFWPAAKRRKVCARVPQVISDLKLVARLEEIRLLASGATERGFDYAGADQQYAAALREYGIDVDALPAEEAIRSLQSRAEVLPALIIALDDWAACRREAENEAAAKPLAELARALEHGPVAPPQARRPGPRE